MNQQTINNQNIFAIIINFFTADNWQFQQIESESVLQMAFQGKHGRWNCYAQCKDEQQQFIFYSVYPLTTPAPQRLAVSEFIARANYGLTIGNFELDFRDGEIRYKTSIDIENDNLSFTCIQNLVYTNLKMMDKYFSGIFSVIHGHVSPMSAIEQIENLPQSLANSQQELTIDFPQTDIQPREPHILAKLTSEEIGQFHQALQMMQPYQRKQTQAIIDKLQKSIIARLGDVGSDVFVQAFAFFSQNIFSVKNLKLIQRYASIAGKARLFLQQLEQYRESSDNSELNLAIKDLETLFWHTNQSLSELPTDKLLGEKELKYLIEIEQLREELLSYERLLKQINNSLDIG
jgi:hypothetical protein